MYLNQLYTFLIFLLTGGIIGILFDIFRILRKSFKTIDIITYIQDIIFWLLTGAILLYSIFTFNNGELRGYVFIGILLGILLYMIIISKYFIKINVIIIKHLKKVIYYPLKSFINILKKHIFNPIYNSFYKLYTKTIKKDKAKIKTNVSSKK